MNIKNDEIITKINDGLSLIIKSDGLTFGTDAYLLFSYVRRQTKAKLVDLGSGTGVISLLLLQKNKVKEAHGIELQPDFAELITRNAELNKLSDRLFAYSEDVRNITADTVCGEADIVVANPPYMKPTGKICESERKNIARHETAGGILDFCLGAKRLLKHGGLFYVVWRPDRLSELFSALSEAYLTPKRMTFVFAKDSLPPCLLLCEAKKGASEGMYVTPPLLMYKQDGSYTDELDYIYKTGDFNESYKRP